MIEWFRNLSDANKIAIAVPVGIAVIATSTNSTKLKENMAISMIFR